MRAAVVAIMVAMLSALSLGCTPDFEKVWLVQDLRVLAIKADPPEQIIRPAQLPVSNDPTTIAEVLAEQLRPIALNVLAVDPRDAVREVAWEVWACTPEESFCDGASLEQRLYGATTRLDQIRYEFTPTPELLLASFQADPMRGFGGLPIVVEFRMADDEFTVRAFKRVVITFPLPYSPVPDTKQPNENPRLESIEGNGETLDLRVTQQVDAETEFVLQPVPTEDSKQSYVVVAAEDPLNITASDGLSVVELEEYLSYDFYTTGGHLSHATTGGKPLPFYEDKKVYETTSKWKASLAAHTTADQLAKIWIVIRDDRGGVNWTSLDVTTSSP